MTNVARRSLPKDRALTAAEISRFWRPTKQKLISDDRNNDLRVRVHRACVALSEAERIEKAQDSRVALDAGLVLRWVGLNALYGQWDEQSGIPMRDRESLDSFTSRVAAIDSDGRLSAVLGLLEAEAQTLLESTFLTQRFWRDQEWENVRPRKGRYRSYRDDRLSGRVAGPLHQLLIVVYFLRCQIVHGGATLGSDVNRVTVEPASRALSLLSGQLLAVVVEHGLEIEWGNLCYPPIRDA